MLSMIGARTITSMKMRHLGQLDVSVNEIREVWEIEAKGELVVVPARLIKVGSCNKRK